MNQSNELTSEHDEQQVVTPLVRVDSKQLFEGQRELIIQHQGEEYRLRITRHDKLILTK